MHAGSPAVCYQYHLCFTMTSHNVCLIWLDYAMKVNLSAYHLNPEQGANFFGVSFPAVFALCSGERNKILKRVAIFFSLKVDCRSGNNLGLQNAFIFFLYITFFLLFTMCHQLCSRHSPWYTGGSEKVVPALPEPDPC